MSKIVCLKAENFKRLQAITLRPSDGLQEIRGRNAQGKSSVLDAVQAALGGAKWAPEQPIRVGEESARVVLETEDLKITRRWSIDYGDRVVIETKGEDRATLKSPQAVLDKLIGGQQFDPLAFSRMKAKEQAAKLRELVGLDTSDLDAEREVVFQQRRNVNRDVDTLKARFESLPEPEDVPEPEAEIETKGFLEELEKAAKVQQKNDLCRREVALIRTQIEDNEQARRKVMEQLDNLDRAKESLLYRLKTGENVVASFTDPDVTDIKARAAEADEHNAKVRAARRRKADADKLRNEWEAMEGQLKAAKRTQQAHTARLEEIDREKAARLAAAKFPIPGLSVADDMVTLNGVPFCQASQSQQIRTGFAIAAACSGTLRTVLCRDGSLLDDQARADLAEWAEANDVQILLEVVGDGGTGIVIEDGMVRHTAAVA